MKIKNYIKFLLITTMFFIGRESFSYGWQPLGAPEGGPVSQLVENSGKVYAVAPGSGIYESTDDGEIWKKLPDLNNDLINVHQIAFDGSNNLYAASNYRELFKSSDKGKNWKKIEVPFDTITKIYSYNSLFFVGTYSGLSFSTDGGNIWKNKNFPKPNSIIDLVYFKNNLIVATNDGVFMFENNSDIPRLLDKIKGVYKLFTLNDSLFACTINKDSKFEIIKFDVDFNILQWNNFRDIQVLDFSVKNSYVALSGIRKENDSTNYLLNFSDDSGFSWDTLYQNKLYTYDNYIWDLNIGLLCTSQSILVGKVIDGVQKFKINDLSKTYITNKGITNMQISSIAFIKEQAYLGTYRSGIYKSEDLFNNFQFIENSPQTLFPFYDPIYKISKEIDSIIVGTRNGIFLSINDFANRYISGEAIFDFVNDSNTIDIISNSSKFIKLDYNGNRKDYDLKGISKIYNIAKQNNIIYISTDKGIFRSNDNGTSFNLMPENNFSKAGYYCLIKYRNNLIAGSPNGLFISSDEANSWNKINDNIFLNILAFENYLIAGTIDGCYISFDSGETWVESNEGIQKRIFSGIYNNKKDVFGTALGDKIHSNKIGDLGKIKISNINKTEFCSKDDLTISYKTAPGVAFNPNNEFIFELFDVNNYNKFTTIYKIKSIDLEHSYTFQIPDSIKFNTNYRIRVRSTSPEFLSIDNLDNITIVQKNLNKISGANVVCQDSTEIYKIATQDGYTYKWSAKGGTITSGDNLPEITVKWQTPGIGSIIVNKVSVQNCNSSDSISITVNPKPAKPTITLSDNMMNISSTEKIKWYLNGSIIYGESNDTLITNTVGNYKVSVANSFGCVSYSDEVVYNPNAVYLLLSSHKASPGEEFTMDIKASKTRSFKELKINEIKATLSFNATTLYPVSAEKGTVNSTDENRYITVTLDTNLDINQVIKQYRLLAMLGNKGMDTVRLINITPNNVFAKNGIFTLNVCLDENGKPRLISSIKTLQIVSVSPNPGNDLIKVDFYTESAEKLKITLANSFGETIKEIGSGEYNSGENSVENSIKDLPFGSYFVIIESLTGRDSFGIIKAK